MHPVQKVSLEPCFSIAEIIHPPHRCGISRCWLDSMIIAQVCLRLATIKGHSKMCSFAVLGGSGGGGARCRIRRSRASQTCSMGDMTGEYAGHARTRMFSAFRDCVQILATWGCALSCCNMRWWSWMNDTTIGLSISSRYLCAFKMPSI